MKKLSKYFINGLIVLVPIGITVFVIVEFLSFTEGVLGKYLPVYFPGMGLFTVLGIIILIGWLSSYWILKRCIEIGEKILSKIPFVKFIYNSVKHLSTAVFESNNLFHQAVLVPYPSAATKALGFVMPGLSAPMEQGLAEKHVCVFIPWSLNMTSGASLLVPEKEVIYLDISTESALQYILTAGAVMPEASGRNIAAPRVEADEEKR